MTIDQCEQRETAIRALWDKGDVDGAATAAIRAYGPEVLGFLVAVHRSEHDAGEVFSIFSERLWQGISGFSWRCSVRAWAYVIARNASRRYLRDRGRRHRREVPLSGCAAVAELAAHIRTETLSCLRTGHPNALVRLREALPPEDQALLILRVDRDLAWLDLARIFLDDTAPSPEALTREAARLRKRFQIVRRRLLDLGRERGVFPDVGPGRGA
jgi:RNA polymerase sigma-70 factor (ECF subfamily)